TTGQGVDRKLLRRRVGIRAVPHGKVTRRRSQRGVVGGGDGGLVGEGLTIRQRGVGCPLGRDWRSKPTSERRIRIGAATCATARASAISTAVSCETRP